MMPRVLLVVASFPACTRGLVMVFSALPSKTISQGDSIFYYVWANRLSFAVAGAIGAFIIAFIPTVWKGGLGFRLTWGVCAFAAAGGSFVGTDFSAQAMDSYRRLWLSPRTSPDSHRIGRSLGVSLMISATSSKAGDGSSVCSSSSRLGVSCGRPGPVRLTWNHS